MFPMPIRPSDQPAEDGRRNHEPKEHAAGHEENDSGDCGRPQLGRLLFHEAIINDAIEYRTFRPALATNQGGTR